MKYIFSKCILFLLILLIFIIINKKTEKFYIKKNYNMFYINLKERTDRKKDIEIEFLKFKNVDNLNFNLTRIDAIKNNYGEIGCAKSHIKALKKAKNENLEYVIIMEDDIIIKKNKIKKYFEIINNLEKWDVIILSGHGNKTKLNKYLYKANSIQTTGMYLIKKHYYDILINNFIESVKNLEISKKNQNLKSASKKWAIDQNWKKLQKKDNWYIFNQNLGYQKPSFSDIAKKNINYTRVLN